MSAGLVEVAADHNAVSVRELTGALNEVPIERPRVLKIIHAPVLPLHRRQP